MDVDKLMPGDAIIFILAIIFMTLAAVDQVRTGENSAFGALLGVVGFAAILLLLY